MCIDVPQSWQAMGSRKVLISSYLLAVRWIEIKVSARTSVWEQPRSGGKSAL